MDFSLSSFLKPVLSKLIALQIFFNSRPRLDVSLIANPANPNGKRANEPSTHQLSSEPSVASIKYDFEFYWNYKLRIKNNSSKTAYGIKIEDTDPCNFDYMQKMDELASLKENEIIELDLKIRYNESMTNGESSIFLTSFPKHLKSINFLISYTNEARKRFYTRFKMTELEKANEHLLRKPKKQK